MVTATSARERFITFLRGHWLDSIGNSIIVSGGSDDGEVAAVLTPLIDHPDARDRVLSIRQTAPRQWRCGNAALELADEQQQRLVWVTEDGRRSVWSRATSSPGQDSKNGSGPAFPWLLHNSVPEPWLPLDIPRDVLYDGARVAALLDIRQMIGGKNEPQERLTHILMDHDLHPMRGDYLIPGAESPLWQTLNVSDGLRRSIQQRIHRIPHEALSQRVSWGGETEIHVGNHKISCRARDIQALDARWVLPPKDERKPLEIARLLALYSVFDNPLSNRRNGVHLGLDPDLRRSSDYELFASPLNAVVPNGHYASKWPHVEWRFGSIGSYPSVLQYLPVNSIVCVNPPFTEAYLSDVMARLAELKLRFRLRIAIPIQEMPWRKKLNSSLPSAELLQTYYDASSENHYDLLHPTLLWEDPRCPLGQLQQPPVVPQPMVAIGAPTTSTGSAAAAAAAAAVAAAASAMPSHAMSGMNGMHGMNGMSGMSGMSGMCGMSASAEAVGGSTHPVSAVAAATAVAAAAAAAAAAHAEFVPSAPPVYVQHEVVQPELPPSDGDMDFSPQVRPSDEPPPPRTAMALDASEWPELSQAKDPSRRSAKVKR